MRSLSDCDANESVRLNGEGPMQLRTAVGKVIAQLPGIREYWATHHLANASLDLQFLPVIWREAGNPSHLGPADIEQLGARLKFQSLN